MTVYEKDVYTRHFIRGVYWLDSRGQSVVKNGIQTTDGITVYIYSGYVPRAGDIIVRGECDYAFDSSDPAALSKSMKTFRASHPDFAVIKTVNCYRFGRLPHTEITAG